MSFKDLKRNSASNFEKLNSELSKINQNFNNNDENIWTCQTDKAKNGFAVIRFLPGAAVDGDDAIPFVRLWSHGFKGPQGTWFIENCPTTLGKDCPTCADNGKYWNSGIDSDKAIARERKRKLNYYSNIYVVKDPANPENEGKVFLFRYGKKIFDKLNEMMNPVADPIDPKDPVNPFDFWTGANFKLKIRQVEGYANYDKSEFEAPGPLLDDDDAMEEIWKSQHSLKAIVDPSKFKSFEELEKKLNKTLGNESPVQRAREEFEEKSFKAEPPKFKEKEAPEQKAASVDDEDEDLAFFKGLIDND